MQPLTSFKRFNGRICFSDRINRRLIYTPHYQGSVYNTVRPFV